MAEFHQIVISDIYKETKDCSVLSFAIPEALQTNFAFIQGQHLTLRRFINGEDVRRSYSLCSSPLEKEWKVAIKQIPGGVFSTFANTELKAGDRLELMEPSGSFFVPLQPTFKLFYLNRTVQSIAFKEEIEQLKNRFFDRFEIFYFLTKEQRDIPLFNGRFDEEKLKTLTTTFIDVPDTDNCFICGPQEMIFLIRDELVKAGMAAEKIHYELFFSGKSAEDNDHIAAVLEHRVEGTAVTIVDGGKEFHFTMEDDAIDNILDGALAAGADLPFACKGGVCSTCKCKVLEGAVEMKVNYALEESEVKNNFVLSCQAVPTTEKVVVDFDV